MAAVLLGLTGCVPLPTPFACSAIGYSSVAEIKTSEPEAGLLLELCSGLGCIPGPAEAPAQVGSTATPTATGVFELTGNSETGWIAVLLDAPTDMGFRLTDSAANTVTEGSIDVIWERVDGTEQCGGNQRADIVINR